MSRKILIDAIHSEEIRLVVSNNNTLEFFDYQNLTKKSTKGNVYLAKVTRVEPSLQAAFVEYGTGKQGFLPFSEIHPDYYQIPASDKQELLKLINLAKQEDSESDHHWDEEARENKDKEDNVLATESKENNFDSLNRLGFHKKYKIQEVIKKDQVILVQVSKEERGKKGASMTTYLSLAGRYCVLMPNASHAGGVSRKIDDAEERKRLKTVIKEVNAKDEILSVIIRTAGSYKTKTEIKRDLNYLKRLWDNIRKHTLSSTAPTFIYEEGDVIKKAIRDLYDSDIEEILIAGTEAYKNACGFMKLILPRHIDKVKEYKDTLPIFSKHKMEEQLSSLYSNIVSLSSGGYLVINQTEALVAIDVNSGRSTSERNIESTAVKTNLEAAQEIAKQLKLRDLSGLIVIDFIDMYEAQNRKSVEKVLKTSLNSDRAKIQTGRISEFGLLELSRQRLRPSFSETHLLPCPNCTGRGKVRPLPSTAVAVLRAVESEITTGIFTEIQVSASQELILYLLNNKREEIVNLEKISKSKIILYVDESAGTDCFFIEKNNVVLEKPMEALAAIDCEPYQETSIPSSDDSITNTDSTENDIKLSNKNAKQKLRRKLYKAKNKIQKKIRNDSLTNSQDITDVNAVANNEINQNAKNISLLKEIWKKIVE